MNSYTTQGQQMQQFSDLLKQITGTIPGANTNPGLTDAYSNTEAAAMQSQVQGQQAAQNYQTTQQQSLINPLISQYGNMDQVFQLYLAHQGLQQQAAQYGNQDPNAQMNPYQQPGLLASSAQGAAALQGQNQADQNAIGSMTTPTNPNNPSPNQQPQLAAATPQNLAGNPYMATPDQTIASTSNLPTAPSTVTSQMTQPLSAATGLTGLLSSLIGAEQGLIGTQSNLTAQNYSTRSNVLNSIASLLGNALNTNIQNANIKDQSGFVIGSKQDAASILANAKDTLLKNNPNATENDLFDYLNQNQAMLKAQGVDTTSMWNTYHSMFGSTKDAALAGGKVTPQNIKNQQQYQKSIDSLKAFNDMMSSYYNTSKGPLSGLGVSYIPYGNNEYDTQKGVYSGSVAKSLTGSRAASVLNDIKNKMPGEIGFTGNADSSFKGHFQVLIQQSDLVIGVPKNGGTAKVFSSYSGLPKGYTEIDPNTLSIDQIKSFLHDVGQ